MLDYNILSHKPEITVVKDGKYVTYKDLSVNINNQLNYNKGSFVVVEQEYIARPDLISLAIYGDDKYADLLCKINGISNPFELNKNMIIYAPDIYLVSKSFKGSNLTSDVLDEFKSLNKTKTNSKSNYTINQTTSQNSEETISKQKKKLQKYKNERRSPGDQTVLDKNYIIDKTLGVVIY